MAPEETGRNCNAGRDFNLAVMGKRNFPAVRFANEALSLPFVPSLSRLDFAFRTYVRVSVLRSEISLTLKITRGAKLYNGTIIAD